VTTKSNVITITDQDDLDFAIQYIDPAYFQYAMKPWSRPCFSAEPRSATRWW